VVRDRLVGWPSYPRAGKLTPAGAGGHSQGDFSFPGFAQHCRRAARSTPPTLPSASTLLQRPCGDRPARPLPPITWASAVSTTSRGKFETLPAPSRKLERKPWTVSLCYWRCCSCGRPFELQHSPTVSQRVEMVRPPCHQLHTLIPIITTRVGTAHRVRLDVR